MAARHSSLSIVLILACSASPDASTTSEITTAGQADENSTSVHEPGTSTGTTSAPVTTTTGPLIDVGSDDLDVPDRCGALDVVLVVERTLLSQIEMANQVAPLLTAGIETRLPGWSVHYLHVIGATGSIPLQCEQGCLDDGSCDAIPELDCEPFDACDWTTGAGIVWRSYDVRCLTKPRRYVDAADDSADQLAACIWETGAQAGYISALGPFLESISPELVGPGGCNEGFLREDAWLLPVIVSHGYPAVEGTPEEWAQQIVDAKGGDLDAIVPVALLDPQQNPGNPPGCQEGPGDLTNGYHDLIGHFPAGHVGDLCLPYTPQILEAVDFIAEQCGAIPN